MPPWPRDRHRRGEVVAQPERDHAVALHHGDRIVDRLGQEGPRRPDRPRRSRRGSRRRGLRSPRRSARPRPRRRGRRPGPAPPPRARPGSPPPRRRGRSGRRASSTRFSPRAASSWASTAPITLRGTSDERPWPVPLTEPLLVHPHPRRCDFENTPTVHPHVPTARLPTALTRTLSVTSSRPWMSDKVRRIVGRPVRCRATPTRALSVTSSRPRLSDNVRWVVGCHAPGRSRIDAACAGRGDVDGRPARTARPPR